MKQLFLIAVVLLCAPLASGAQTFTDHLRQKQPGKGTVTLNQSKEIDNLVNGNNASVQQQPAQQLKPAAQSKAQGKTQGERQPERVNAQRQDNDAVRKEAKHVEEHKEKEREAAPRHNEAENEEETVTVDTRKKVMRGAHKVTGYRVQAFAGGNSRADKNKAQSIGNAIKMKYPEQPIYVHFYNPRWVCRVGNFRSYAEAADMLKKVRAMGYKSATILKGKITVQY